jgi:hypothetical protein
MQKVYIDAEWVAKEYLHIGVGASRISETRRKTQKPFGAGIWSVFLM